MLRCRRHVLVRGRDPVQMMNYNKAMNERFKTRRWHTALPEQGRLPKFPHCARCYASFVLDNAVPGVPP